MSLISFWHYWIKSGIISRTSPRNASYFFLTYIKQRICVASQYPMCSPLTFVSSKWPEGRLMGGARLSFLLHSPTRTVVLNSVEILKQITSQWAKRFSVTCYSYISIFSLRFSPYFPLLLPFHLSSSSSSFPYPSLYLSYVIPFALFQSQPSIFSLCSPPFIPLLPRIIPFILLPLARPLLASPRLSTIHRDRR